MICPGEIRKIHIYTLSLCRERVYNIICEATRREGRRRTRIIPDGR